MTKIDFKKELKELYNPKKTVFSVVEVPEMQFLMVSGQGSPGVSQEYQDALEALYPMAYKLKFMSKQTLERDYVVPPLEGLWWAEDMSVFVSDDRDAWLWQMMIMTPEWIDAEMFAAAMAAVAKKGTPTALDKVRLEPFAEGLSVQILHVGPYADEGATIAALHHEFLPANGMVENGEHHEIYLNDPRRTAPEKLRTVLRQPVRRDPVSTSKVLK
jgi:hypothetical protein